MGLFEARKASMSRRENRRTPPKNHVAHLLFQVLALLCASLLPVAAYSQAPLFTFAQISDSQPRDAVEQERFERVLDTIVAAGQPDALIPQPISFVMFAGDLVNIASNDSDWTTFISTIDTRLTANGIPYRAVPGNHDWNSTVGFSNYETYIGSADVWETGSNVVSGHNGLTVSTGWHGLDFIGINNSNGGDNAISSADLSLIDLLASQASVRNENIFLLAHHHHDESSDIPLTQTLNNTDVVGYMRGHSGSPHATSGLSGIQNPNVWDLSSHGIINRGGILYYEVYQSQIVVYPIQLTENDTSLPSPKTIILVHNLVPAGPPVAPTADFVASPRSGTAPLTVVFSDQSAGLPTSWNWDFGDGSTATAQNPVHTFGQGSFDVSLAVSNAEGSDSLIEYGLINVEPAPPTATFTAVGDAHVRSSKLTTNYGTLDRVRIRAGSTAYNGYFMFDVGGLGGESVLSATLRLYVDDGSNDGGTLYQVDNSWSEQSITWGNAPSGTAIGNLGSVSSGTWVEYDVSAQVQWEGTYSFALISSSTNSAYYSSREGVSPPELVLEIGAPLPPIAEFSADSTSGSAPHTVQFQDLSSNGPDSWLWNFGDGNTSTDQNPSHTYATLGSYTVSLDVGNAVGSDDEIKDSYIAVSAPIAPVADFSADTTLGPMPLSVSFRDLSTGNPTSWQWDFGDGSGSTAQNPTHQYTTAGPMTVTLEVTNAVSNDQRVRPEYITVTVPPPGSTFVPIADAKVKSSSLSRNYGSENNLRVRGGTTDWKSYLKFDVVGLQGPVESATLRLFVTDRSNDGGTLFSVPDTAWTELGLTYGNAPSFEAVLGNAGSTNTGQWVEFDVTSVVSGEGQVGFGLSSSSSNSGYFYSREGLYPPELVVLTGSAGPDIRVTPLSHDYGAVVVGQSANRVVNVTNEGSETLIVTGSAVTGADASAFGVTGGGAFSLAPGGSQNVQVNFTPGSAGSKSATLQIASDDADEPLVQVSLQGTGALLEPDIAVTPTSHNFGSVAVTQSGSYNIAIVNNGTAALNVTGLSLGGTNPGDFGLGGPGTFALAPGASQNVQVSFIPGSVGAKSATLLITSDDPDEASVQVSLQGTGALLEPDIAVTPTSHNFGSVAVTQSGSYNIAIVNNGTAALNVTGLSLGGTNPGDFGLGGPSSFALAPGASQNVQVSFIPGSAGAKSATLLITSDDPDEASVQVSLQGTGALLEPDIAVTPTSHNFGSVGVTQSGSHTVVIMNSGTSALNVTGLSLGGANPGDFGLGGPGTFALAPGASQNVQVSFIPGSVGAKSATLLIASDDPDEASVQVSLQGTGTQLQPDISVNPTSHDFGLVSISQSSSQNIVIVNNGSAALNVSSTNFSGANAADFSVSNGGAFSLAPGVSRNVQVSFNPASLGVKNAVLEVASDDADEPLVSVNVSGEGTAVPAANISLQEVKIGGASDVASVSTSAALAAADGHVYVAAISSKAFRSVSAVSGLGLVWTEQRGQCAGRNQTGVSIWTATGTPSASSDVVTAELSGSASNAVIAVTRYSGVGSVGSVTSANSNGVSGACSGGTDAAGYSVNLNTTGAKSVVHAAVAMRSRAHTAGGGFTEQMLVSQGESGGSIAGVAVLDQLIDSSSTVDVTGTFSGTVDWAVAAVELKP